MTDDKPWPVWKLAVYLYVFTAGAVAINLFMAGLILHGMAVITLSPELAVILALPLGIPAAWAAGKWARRLMDEAR